MTETRNTIVQSDRLVPARDLQQNKEQDRYAWPVSPLWLCLLAALLLRTWFALRTHGTLDGDEALLGIQAEHILQGERPIYFYGIPYFGSLEAYVAACLFALFGPSVAVLRAEATGFALLLVTVTWWLASLLAQAAQLPLAAKRWFVTIAPLVAAIPPLYDGIVELRTGGGWIESFVLMLLLLVCAHRLTSRWHAGASARELALRWAGLGLVVGFGMWIYPLVTVAILAAALWILINRVAEFLTRVRASEPLWQACTRAFGGLLLAVAALPTCLLGFTPGLIWGAGHRWENITYLFALGGGWTARRVLTIARVGVKYATCVAPRVISGATPREGLFLTVLHAPLLLIGALCIAGTAALVVTSLRWQTPLLLRARRLAALPLLFGVCSAMLFCTSSASTSILPSCNDDFGGHYAAPLVLALPFCVATVFTLLALVIAEKKAGTRTQNGLSTSPVWSPIALAYQRPAMLLAAILLVYFGGQAATYGLTDADRAFQSAYCTIAPADYTPLVTYMQREHIQYAWATNLLGYPVSFRTNNAIILADPLPLMHPRIAINRIPAYTAAVARSDRPSFLVFVRHGDPQPSLLQQFAEEHVAYKTAVFPSQPGVDVLIATPLNRTISPFTSVNFDIFYCSIR